MSKHWDLSFEHRFSELPSCFYTAMLPEGFAKCPRLIHANPQAAALLELSSLELSDPDFTAYFSGNKLLPGSKPLAMVYSGHQFGQWAGQLGDGRALLLGQVRNVQGELWDIQLKGGGLTPYSRSGDGRAVLRSCIREYLCSEALYGLGVPTTRALCIMETGEQVWRETKEPGAIFTRLARSHIRFGHFEHFYYRKQFSEVKILADHVIAEYFPEIASGEGRYREWFSKVMNRTASLIANWQAVGFSHGVMNTDNMSILGLTLDYGPFGFMENFIPGFICNHSDIRGRYAYDQQPRIGLWNLYALALALQPLLPLETSKDILQDYDQVLTSTYQRLMRSKLGLTEEESDNELWLSLIHLMAEQQSDYTLTFRYLADSFTDPNKWLNLFAHKIHAEAWLNNYHKHLNLKAGSIQAKLQKLKAVNPKFVLRNWVAEVAIREASDKKDYTMLDNLLTILHTPYDEHPEFDYLSMPAPKHYQSLAVSCSS